MASALLVALVSVTASGASSRGRLRLTQAPTSQSTSRDATFAWTMSPAGRTTCRLDRGSWKPCVKRTTYRRLGLGKHVFSVRARGGGRKGSRAQFVWTIVAGTPPPAPTITSGPASDTSATDAVFLFASSTSSAFECRLDSSPRQPCASRAEYVGLALGGHTFCVRAVDAASVASAEVCFAWTVHDVVSLPPPVGSFGISGSLLTTLSPGVGGPLALTVSNPSDVDLRVTALIVTVLPGSSRPGCDGPSNLQVAQSNAADGSIAIVVPAHESVTLPAQGATAPRVSMLDLVTNQNACKHAAFALSYSGMGTEA